MSVSISASINSTEPAVSAGSDLDLRALLEGCSRTDQIVARLGKIILDLEDVMRAQLNAILENAEIQALEASWRGLKDVVETADEARDIKIKIIDVNWDELSHELHGASDLKRTHLFQLIGRDELDTLGGEPFGLLFIDHALSMSLESEFDELFTAQLICSLAEKCLSPAVIGIADDFFGETDASWMTDTRRLRSILNSAEYSGWQALRNVANARFLGLVTPRVLLRGRYENLDTIAGRFTQREEENDGLWGNGAICFLRTVIAEYRRVAWFGFLKYVSDQPGQGAVLGPLPANGPKNCVQRDVCRVRLSRWIGQFLSEEGFIPICESSKLAYLNAIPEAGLTRGEQGLYLLGNRSVSACNGNREVEVTSQIQSVMIACRLMHFIKVKMRELIGQTKTAEECERSLREWLETYGSNVAQASSEILARFPLKEAKIQITKVDSDDTRFQCQIYLKPQYQVDHVLGEIALSTDFENIIQGAV